MKAALIGGPDHGLFLEIDLPGVGTIMRGETPYLRANWTETLFAPEGAIGFLAPGVGRAMVNTLLTREAIAGSEIDEVALAKERLRSHYDLAERRGDTLSRGATMTRHVALGVMVSMVWLQYEDVQGGPAAIEGRQ